MSNKILLIVSVLLSTVGLEYGLRALGTVPITSGERSFVDGLGPWRKPGTFVPRPRYSDAHHDGYTTNSVGMVDAEPAFPDSRKIAIVFLGDSIIEGLAVPPGRRVTDLLRSACRLGATVENYATSGVGTVQELAIYRELVREHRPNVVVLSIYPGNDIANNDPALSRQFGDTFLSHWVSAVAQNDTLVWFRPELTVDSHSGADLDTFRKLMPAAYAHLSWLKHRLQLRIAARSPQYLAASSEAATGYLDVYRPPKPRTDWSRAWRTTEIAILQLRNLVEADGGKFYLAILPDPIQSWRDQSTAIAASAGDTINVFYPHERLLSFATENSIDAVPLFRSFKLYQDSQQLGPPYFGFPTDGHWNEVAHRLAADVLARSLPSCQSQSHPALD